MLTALVPYGSLPEQIPVHFDGAGKPVLTVHDLTLDVAEDDIDFNLSGEDCTGLDSIANAVVDFGTDYLLDEGLGLVSSLATGATSRPLLS